MSIPVFTNDAASTLSAAITSTATSLTLVGGGGAPFPSPTGGNYFVATLISQSNPNTYEIIHCTTRATDTLTIVRGQEGTTALAWNIGDMCNLQLTAGSLAIFAAASTPVLSVSGGTNITIGGTAQNPTVSAPGVALLAGANFTGPVTISNTLTTAGVANFNTSTLESKENPMPITADVDKFMRIEPISYIHKASRLPSDGFSAENIAGLFPELVMFKEGKPYALNYSGIIPHAVAMIQNLTRRVDELESMLNSRTH